MKNYYLFIYEHLFTIRHIEMFYLLVEKRGQWEIKDSPFSAIRPNTIRCVLNGVPQRRALSCESREIKKKSVTTPLDHNG